MVTPGRLLNLMKDSESDRVERTVSERKWDKFGEAICAFSNDLSNSGEPGYLLIGVTDDGELSGLEVTDELMRNVGALRSDGNLLPQPTMTLEKVCLEGGEVLVVKVAPSDFPPVRYKSRCWIRVGPRRAVANEQDERALFEKRQSKARTFDTQSCGEATVNDLVRPLFEAYRMEAVDAETLAANNRSYEEQLASLRFFDTSLQRPTNAGIILFGKNSRFFLPGAYVQLLVFPGTDITDMPIDQAEIGGDLASVVRQVEERLKSTIRKELVPGEGFREKVLENYPYWAVRELFLNSLMHRDWQSNSPNRLYLFSNRIEIDNPGGLYGEATQANFPKVNSYRNPVLAEALKTLGFVNRFGYGVARAQQMLRENQNPPAQFTHFEYSTKVELYSR